VLTAYAWLTVTSSAWNRHSRHGGPTGPSSGRLEPASYRVPVNNATAETVSIALLALALVAAIFRPFRIPESAIAVPAALLSILVGIEPWNGATRSVHRLAATVGFLIAILVFGRLCAAFGVFTYLGAQAQRASRGRATRLLPLVVGLAAMVTAVLTLDATVVLLTPVVLATTARMGVRSRPHVFACLHLANSGSLLLPVSNLTNLLAYAASGLTFARFTGLMAAPWVIACGLEYVVLRVSFAGDLRGNRAEGDSATDPSPSDNGELPSAPTYALVVLGVTVIGFVAVSALGWPPAWAALGGVLALGVPALHARRTALPGSMRTALASANLGFAAFVFALGVLVDAVTRHGLGRALGHLTPRGDGLLTMLAVAFLAAALSNVVNNLPATLALIPVVTGQPALMLAMLIGVNVGPNLTYPGSLANLLWDRLLPAQDRPSRTSFHLLGLATVPVLVAAATATLWLAVAV
jgi:arsenical pump membrane protein